MTGSPQLNEYLARIVRLCHAPNVDAPEHVRYWPKADMPKNAIDVAFEGKADMTFCDANVCL
jgi:hypothetical protein